MNESKKSAKKPLNKSLRTIKSLLLVSVLVSLKHISYGAEPPTSNNGSESANNPLETHNGSKYDAATAEEKENAEIKLLSKKVLELNINAARDDKRRAELQDAVDRGAPGSASAIGELQVLRQCSSIKERERYIQELEAKGIELSKNLAATKIKIEKLKVSRDSWFNRNKTSELDAEERKLYGWLSSLASATRINDTLLELLKGNVTSTTTAPQTLTPDDIQSRFFPTVPTE